MGHTIGLRRNIAFCGHTAAGKTTLLDQMLLESGAATGQHSVDDQTSICDYDNEEKLHRYTIECKVVHARVGNVVLNMLDTPGYTDLIGQTIEALAAADCAALCIHAHAGIEVNTRRVFRESSTAGLGRIVVLTRLDGENIDFEKLWANIQETFGPSCALVNVPVGISKDLKGVADILAESPDPNALMDVSKLREAFIERIVESDEDLMARYFEGDVPSASELKAAAAKAVVQGTLIPVFCTAAKQQIGVNQLLQGLVWAAPSPDQVERFSVDEEGSTHPIQQDSDGPLIARVFKTRIDPFVQKLSFIRIYSGSLARDQSVHVVGQRKDLKMAPILDVQAGQTQPIDHGEAGDIVAVAKMEDLHIGTTLGDTKLPELRFPTPMVGVAVTPKGHADENKLFSALHKLVEEDPTLRVQRDQQTSELVMTGMSELHLNLIQERLQHRDKLEIATSDPKIPLRETVQAFSEGSYRHKKQSGGRGQFGEVHMRILPLPKGTNIEEFATKERFPQMKHHHYDPLLNFLWVDSIVGGSIPVNFMPAVEKGVRDRMQRGVLAGYIVQDICVEVFYGKHHPVDSSEAAFKTAAAMAFRDIFQKAKPCLLEPIVQMQVTIPEACMGDLYSDMSSRGGRVHGSEVLGSGWQCISCEAPLRSVLHFGRVLSNLSGGQGSFTMEGSHYEMMPASVQHEYTSKAKVQEEDELLV
jgi:elongation factor G